MLRQTASGPASQIDIGRSEGQRVYHNNKPLVAINEEEWKHLAF